MEIKSILSFGKEAVFPTVYSQRAIDQLLKISTLLDAGYSACYLFVSMNPSVKQVVVNKDIEEYSKAFKQCISKGMKVKGVSVKIENDDIAICSSIKTII